MASLSISKDNYIVRYFYLWRKEDREWCYSTNPFVIHNTTENHINGSFLSSNWYKCLVPKKFDIAIIKICVDKEKIDNIFTTIQESFTKKVEKCLKELNKHPDLSKLSYVIMYHSFGETYLNDVKIELNKKIETENDDKVSIHKRIQTDTGLFSITFTQIKNENPCMYCPRFSI